MPQNEFAGVPPDVARRAAGLPEAPEVPKTLGEALLAFQANLPRLVKDAEAEVKDKAGKKLYRYKFLTLQALLEDCRPRMAELGLLWRSLPTIVDGKPALRYSIEHVPSKERDEDTMPLVVGGTMQAYGGAISFARRYALLAALNLAPDVDEDGAVPPAAEGGRKITKAVAQQLVAEADKLGLAVRLQLAGSHVHGADVGDCSTKAKAVAAMAKLTEEEAERLFNRLAQLAAAQQEQG